MTSRLKLYSRAQCGLCEEMKALAAPIASRFGLAIDTIDIDRDADLARRYNLDIPLLELDGREIARHRLDVRDLENTLAADAKAR